MKNAILILMLLAGGNAFALTSAEAIYNALNVQEIARPVSKIGRIFQKSAGGLNCIKHSEQLVETKFHCSLDLISANSEAIYNALNVVENTLPDSRTELSYQKAVGNLKCIRLEHIHNPDSFTCSVSL